jgi:sugar phosphate isomerase/epimerase
MVAGAGVLMLLAASGCAAGGRTTGPGTAEACRWDLAIQSYTFRSDTLLDAVDKTHSLGVKYLESCGFQPLKPGMSLDKATPEARQELMQKLRQAGVKMVNYYGELRQDEAGLRKLFARAKEMGVQTIVGEPDAKDIGLVDKLTAEYGINVAIHNHWKDPAKPEYRNWNPDEVMSMLKGCSKRMGVCPDTGHWARSGIDPVQGLRTYEGRIMDVHLKDVAKPVPASRDVPCGSGIGNIKGCLAELARQKFSGVIAIEYEHNPEDNMADVAQCIKYFQQVKQELSR